jgi:hypothetical protein
MKTTIEINGFEIVIEEIDGLITVSAVKDEEVIEEFEIQSGAQSDGEESQDNEEESQDDSEEMGEMMPFGEEEEEDFQEEESQEESQEEEEEEEEGSKLESFQSFLKKRK